MLGWELQKFSRVFFVLACAAALAACQTTAEEPQLTLQEELPPPPPPSPETLGFAERALEDARYEDAQQLAERILYADPEHQSARLILAEVHLAKGRTADAAREFGHLIGSSEVGARALQGRGIALMLQGKSDDGATHLSAAVDQDASLWRAWNALGAYYDSLQEWDLSVASYDRAVQLRPSSAVVLNNLGYSLFMRGEVEKAIEALTRAVRKDPQFDVAKNNLRLAYARKGQYVHALTGTSSANQSQVLNNIGYIALLRGDYDNAESYLLRAMEADAGFNEKAWKNLNFLKDVQKLDGEETALQ